MRQKYLVNNQKQNMEREANICGVNIKSFRADNGVFKSKEFKLELEENGQAVTFCGVGAHHQNGISERYIRTMVERTRTVLLNDHDRWPEIVDIELWIFAFRHIVTKWNNTPRPDLEYKTPDKVFSGVKRVKNEENHFADFHPFSISVYVLDDRLQAKRKSQNGNQDHVLEYI